jgi:Flp pilus assembly protein TadD
MKPGNPLTRNWPFQLVRGDGRLPQKKEAEQLDRFLTDADPILIASLQTEEQELQLKEQELRVEEQELRQGLRRRKQGLSLALLLGIAVAIPLLWASGFAQSSGKLANRVASVASEREKALLLIEQGTELLSRDRYNEALGNFTLATRIAPDFADAWTALGDCQLKNYQSALAEKAYLRAIALEPGNKKPFLGLGNLYLRRGEEAKAENAWSRGGLEQQLARLCLLQGRFPEAEAYLTGLLNDSPEDELLNRMAQAAKAKHLEPGLRSLLEPEPTGMSSWADLGWRLIKHEQYDEATAAFGKALDEVPHDVNALSGMGGALLALDRTHEAKIYFERALDLDNDHVQSLNGLARCLKNEGKISEAIALWQGMSQLYPGVNYGTPGLAWTYYELGDYNQAALYFAQLVRRYPYDSRVIDALNVAVENIGSQRSY